MNRADNKRRYHALVAGVLSGGGGAWTPASPVNGVLPVVWLAADKLVGYANNDVVQTWANEGSFAADATTVDAAKYVYKTGIINGLPAVDVNLADTFMTVAALFDASYNTALTAYVLCPGPMAGSSGGATIIKNKALNAGFMVTQQARTISPQVVASYPTAMPISNTTLFSNWVYGMTYNGSRVRQAVNGNFTDYAFSSNLALTGDLVIGGIAGQATNYRQDGYTAEILIYKAAFSDADFLIPLQYLANKYNLPFCDVRICTLGDSLTFGTGSTGGNDYPHQLMALLGDGYYLLNLGVFGSDTTTLETGQGAAANAYFHADPTVIYPIWIGTNDIAAGTSAATIATNIATIHAARKTAHPTVKTIAVTIVDRTAFDAAKDAVRATLNTNLVDNYVALGFDAVCDLRGIPQLEDSTNTTYFTDGTHLTNAGYALVAAALQPVIQSLV